MGKQEAVTQESTTPLVAVQAWRQQLIRSILRVLTLLGLLALAVGSYRAYSRGSGWTIPIYLGAYAVLVLVTIWRRAPYVLQVGVLLSLCYSLGVVDVVNFYLSGDGALFFLIFSALTMLLLGQRWGILALVLCVLTMLAFGGVFSVGLLTVPVEKLLRDNTDLSSWLSIAVVFLMLGVLLVFSQNYVLRHLLTAFARSHDLARELEADIIERKRAEEVQAAIYRISEAAQTAQTLDELFGSIHAIIGELMPARNFYIALYDASADLFRFPYHTDEFDDVWLPITPGKSLTGYVLRTGKPLLATPQVFGQLVQSGQIDLVGAGSVDWLGVPLKTQLGETIGVMAVQTYTEAIRLREADKDILIFVSTQVAMVIERKRAEEALHESEQRFRTIFDSVNDAIFVHDLASGNILDVNRRVCEMYGYTREEARQLSVGELSAGEPPYTQLVALEWMKRVAAGEPQLFEWRAKHKSGRLFWVEVNMRRAVIGGQDRLLVVARDITERKRAELVQAAIYRISEAAQATQDLDELFAVIHAIIGELMPAKNFYITLYDASADLFTIPYLADEFAAQWPPYKPGKGLGAYVLRTGKPLLVTPEVFEQLEQSGQAEILDRRMVDWLGVPLKTQHGTLGVMAVQTYTEAARLGEANKDVLVFVSTQVATAIERKQAEEALRLSEDKFSKAFHTSPDSININRLSDGLYIEINQGFTAITGYTAEDVKGKTSLELDIWADPEDRARLIQRLRAQGGVTNLEAPFRLKNGRVVTGLMSARIIEVDGEQCVLSITRDITERKQAEERIRKLNRMLQVINEANQALVRAAGEAELLQRVCQIIVEVGGYRMAWVGIAEQDEATLRAVRPVAAAGHDEGYLDTANITWADTERGRGPTGTAIRTGQPAISRNISTDPDYAPWREQALQSGYVSTIALPLLSNGRAFGVLDIYAAEPDAFDAEEVKLLTEMADDLAYGIVALHTRAEHQRAEKQIKRLNQDLERRAKELAALNKAGQIMASTLDLGTLLKQVMEQVQGLLEAEGASVLLCTPPSGQAGDSQADMCSDLVFAAATGSGSEKLVGTRLSAAAGIVGWAVRERQSVLVADAQSDPRFDNRIDTVTGMITRSILAVPLIYKGSVLGVVEAVNKDDGTFDEHDLEVLEALASSGAIAVENAQLYAAEQQHAAALARALEQQRELDRLQREFIQNVAHELRTPLALIRGHAELLENRELGDLQTAQQESVSVISRRTQMLGKLVEDIVAVLTIEAQELKRESLSLAQLVRTSLADFRAVAEKAGLTLSAEIAPGVPPVPGDVLALRRALDNLVINALKFTLAGGHVIVRLLGGEDAVTLQVSDTGVGIPNDQLERIFERFYQVDGSTTRRYGGVGLGLALVKEIVEAHGGQVTVTSQVGTGTTFTIRLPIA